MNFHTLSSLSCAGVSPILFYTELSIEIIHSSAATLVAPNNSLAPKPHQAAAVFGMHLQFKIAQNVKASTTEKNCSMKNVATA